MTSSSPDLILDNLYPALIQCFAIILCGYVAGRTNIITDKETKGFTKFVGTFSLPALIFMSLSQLDLHSVNWWFLFAVLLAKSVIFCVVSVGTIICSTSGTTHFGRAGIFAIFCTQSNDFAIGYPIVQALYKSTHPEYPLYLYLMAPISLIVLNPIGFVLLELSRTTITSSRSVLILSVLKNVLFNPIVVMTVLGLGGNFVFQQHKVPVYLGGFLDMLGAAFSGSALFLLGLRMVGKVHQLKGRLLIVSVILILFKLIVLPLVTKEIISIVNVGTKNTSETRDFSTFGFLYGTFPSAPTVFLFATQYQVDIDLIASAMVACTFLSAPLMFISARMITVTDNNSSATDLMRELWTFSFDISVIGLIAAIWVLFVFVVTKRVRRLPHKITSCLVLSQFISCLGVILWSLLKIDMNWARYLQFSIYTFGVYSTRLWTMILAVTLLFLQCKTICFTSKLQPLFIVIGWGVPLVLVGLLLIFDHNNLIGHIEKTQNPNFIYGIPHTIVTITLLIVCLIVIVGCLIQHQRHQIVQHQTKLNRPLLEGGTSDSSASSTTTDGALSTIPEDIEDILTASTICTNRGNCVNDRECRTILRHYETNPFEQLEDEFNPQILRHTIVLVLYTCSIFIGISLAVWQLITTPPSGGVYVELSYLDGALNVGQSIIMFAVFAFDDDSREMVWSLLNCWRNQRTPNRTNENHPNGTIGKGNDSDGGTAQVCDQFRTYHLVNCRDQLVGDRKYRFKTYRDVLTGTSLVDWLLTVGLVEDRRQGVNYGRHLVDGGVLRHVANDTYQFYDRNLLYTFEI